ncbi:MAG: hypothetical protein IJJ82_04350 [Clostridia bacterium]|nr:hypothetical protein [Clostridia bacterium]
MKKSLVLILIVSIIAGLIVIFTVGFNLKVTTKAHQEILVNIGEEYKNEEVKQLAKEVIGNDIEVQKTGDFEDQAVISAETISKEQVTEIVNKINEKYGKEISDGSITINDVPAARVSEMFMPQIWSFIIATIIIFVYFAIRYKKQGVARVLLTAIIGLGLLELLVSSIIALIRIPVGQNIVSIIYITYAIAMLVVTTMFEKKAQQLKLEEEKKKK